MESQYIFLTAWCLLVTIILLGLYLRGKNEISKFPDPQTVKIVFKERRVSGRAISGNYFILNGVNRVLHVYVTEDELWIKTHWIHGAVAGQSGMLHKIKLTQIENIEINAKGQVVVNYQTLGGVKISFWLRLQSKKEFTEAVGIEKLRTTP